MLTHIDEAIAAHLQWMHQFNFQLATRERLDIDVARLGNARACVLGEWLDTGHFRPKAICPT